MLKKIFTEINIDNLKKSIQNLFSNNKNLLDSIILGGIGGVLSVLVMQPVTAPIMILFLLVPFLISHAKIGRLGLLLSILISVLISFILSRSISIFNLLYIVICSFIGGEIIHARRAALIDNYSGNSTTFKIIFLSFLVYVVFIAMFLIMASLSGMSIIKFQISLAENVQKIINDNYSNMVSIYSNLDQNVLKETLEMMKQIIQFQIFGVLFVVALIISIVTNSLVYISLKASGEFGKVPKGKFIRVKGSSIMWRFNNFRIPKSLGLALGLCLALSFIFKKNIDIKSLDMNISQTSLGFIKYFGFYIIYYIASSLFILNGLSGIDYLWLSKKNSIFRTVFYILIVLNPIGRIIALFIGYICIDREKVKSLFSKGFNNAR